MARMASEPPVDDFYGERHQTLYRAMLDLQEQGTTIDVRTVQARLEQRNQLESIGGLAYIASLDLDLPDLGRVDAYVEIVKERSLRRRLIRMCSNVSRDCLDGGVDAMRDRIGEWQYVVGRASGRRPIEHGVVLAYDHDAFRAPGIGFDDLALRGPFLVAVAVVAVKRGPDRRTVVPVVPLAGVTLQRPLAHPGHVRDGRIDRLR